jgi:Alcohol dehydrogenase GroES-like domain
LPTRKGTPPFSSLHLDPQLSVITPPFYLIDDTVPAISLFWSLLKEHRTNSKRSANGMCLEASGICRSDWHLWQDDRGWIGFKLLMPTVLGHESACDVEEVGKDVKTLKPGMRVVVPVAQGCGVFEDCSHRTF